LTPGPILGAHREPHQPTPAGGDVSTRNGAARAVLHADERVKGCENRTVTVERGWHPYSDDDRRNQLT